MIIHFITKIDFRIESFFFKAAEGFQQSTSINSCFCSIRAIMFDKSS